MFNSFLLPVIFHCIAVFCSSTHQLMKFGSFPKLPIMHNDAMNIHEQLFVWTDIGIIFLGNKPSICMYLYMHACMYVYINTHRKSFQSQWWSK